MAPGDTTGAHTVPSSGTGAQTVLVPGANDGANTGTNAGAEGSATGSRGATPVPVSGAASGQTLALVALVAPSVAQDSGFWRGYRDDCGAGCGAN